MRRLTRRERDAIAVGSPDGLSEQEAAAFAKLQPSLPAGAVIWEHRAIRFGPFCGVLRAGGVTVELLPKVDDGRHSDESARGLLISMLRTTGTLSVSSAGEAPLGQQSMHLLDHFILDFCARVNSALRGGAIARYQEHDQNLHALRGRLRLTDHLRVNAFDHSRLFCSFDERTTDNPYNRILKAVLALLRPLAIGSHAKATVASLLHRFDEVAGASVTPLEIDRLIFDRMIRRWEPVFEHAKWLLQGLFPDVRAGEIDGTCLLFNMEKLFEAFLGVKLRRAWQNAALVGFRFCLQGPQKSLAQTDSGTAFSLKPDITVQKDGDVIRVFDAKWKRLDPRKPNAGISPADVYQLSAYASRYRCRSVSLVYPATTDCPAGLVGSFRTQYS